MKGIIRGNLGESRYQVGIKIHSQPLADLLEKAQKAYEQAQKDLLEAQKTLEQVSEPYNDILQQIAQATSNYQAELNTFKLSECIEAKRNACDDLYDDCRSRCVSDFNDCSKGG